MSTPQRVAVGFIAAVLSVIVFHQGMILLLRETGLFGFPQSAVVWNLTPNPRAFGLPALVNLCFWGGVYGAVFGLLAPHVRLPLWLWGLIIGALTTMVGFFVLAPLRGIPIAGGWQAMAWLRGLSIGISFGLGLWLFYLAIGGRFLRSSPAWR